jgi:hypothetical protein
MSLYANIKDKIKPFDLILFKGTECVSKCIQFISKSNWSHAGIVVNTDILPIKNGIPGKLYIWESTAGGCGFGPVDVETGEAFIGTQIRDLEAVVKVYLESPGAEVGWVSLKNNIYMNERLKKPYSDIMDNLYRDLRREVYQFNLLYALGAVFNCFRYFRVFTACCKHNVFCSQLVAKVYVALNIFPAYVDPCDITPGEFITEFQRYFQELIHIVE